MELVVSIAGVIVAFLVGLFAEPIRLYFANRHEKNQLRKALYREMAYMYARMNSISHASITYDWDIYKKSLQTIARFESYDYAKSNPMLLYQLSDVSAIHQTYAWFKTYIDGFLFKDVDDHVKNSRLAAQTIEGLLINGELNKNLFLGSFAKDSREDLERRLKQPKDLANRTAK